MKKNLLLFFILTFVNWAFASPPVITNMLNNKAAVEKAKNKCCPEVQLLQQCMITSNIIYVTGNVTQEQEVAAGNASGYYANILKKSSKAVNTTSKEAVTVSQEVDTLGMIIVNNANDEQSLVVTDEKAVAFIKKE